MIYATPDADALFEHFWLAYTKCGVASGSCGCGAHHIQADNLRDTCAVSGAAYGCGDHGSSDGDSLECGEDDFEQLSPGNPLLLFWRLR
jgi:hypothetical protein